MAPLIISNDLRIPSLELHEEGGGFVGEALLLEDNISGVNSYIQLESNIGDDYLEAEDNI